MIIYFMRHGESLANKKRIFSHRGLVHGLSLKGKHQVKKACKQLRSIQASKIISSPNIRARETADIVKKNTGLDYITDERIQEINMGIFEGQSDRKAWKQYRNMNIEWFINHNHDFSANNGERYTDVINRARSFLDELQTIQDEYVIIITHSGFLRCIIPFFTNNVEAEFAFKNSIKFAMFIKVKRTGDTFTCLSWGNHLLT